MIMMMVMMVMMMMVMMMMLLLLLLLLLLMMMRMCRARSTAVPYCRSMRITLKEKTNKIPLLFFPATAFASQRGFFSQSGQHRTPRAYPDNHAS